MSTSQPRHATTHGASDDRALFAILAPGSTTGSPDSTESSTGPGPRARRAAVRAAGTSGAAAQVGGPPGRHRAGIAAGRFRASAVPDGGQATVVPLHRSAALAEQLRAEIAEHSAAAETRRSYAGHQRAWRTWCTDNGVHADCARPQDVANHLTEYLLGLKDDQPVARDDTGAPVAAVAAVSVRQRLAAIDRGFSDARLPRPGADPVVKSFMEGTKRLYGVAPVHAKAPLLLDDLRRAVAALCLPSAAALRDLVMIELRRTAGATPGQLARLDWADVRIGDTDAYLEMPPDRRGGRRRRVRLRGSRAADRCPVQALRWLQVHSGGAGAVLTGPTGASLTRQAVDKRLRSLTGRQAKPGAMGEEGAAWRVSTKALRDAALLTTGWFAALRRTNITALRWSDLEWHEDAVRLRLRRSKTDQHGQGAYNWLPRLVGDVACPVAALMAWRDRMTELLGGDPAQVCPEEPVFPSMDRHDRVKVTGAGRMRRLRGEDVNDLVQQVTTAIGLADPAPDARHAYGGHSLRAGFVTQACMAGVPLVEIAKVTHHEDLRTLAVYSRTHDRHQLQTVAAVVSAA